MYGAGGATGDRLLVHGDHIYLSHSQTGGVRKLPLAGGTAQLIPDTEGYHLLAWPWIAKSTSEPGGEREPRIFTDMRSLENGEERPAKLPDRGFHSVACGVTYCAGEAKDGKSYSWNRDGSEEKVVPGSVDMMMEPPGGDRFLFLRKEEGGSPWLYDMKTGKSGSLGIVADPDGSMEVPGFATVDSRAFDWSLDSYRSYLVFDMAAVT